MKEGPSEAIHETWACALSPTAYPGLLLLFRPELTPTLASVDWPELARGVL
ncbi:hypothetical protein D3C71_2224130 [compost metagenome]